MEIQYEKDSNILSKECEEFKFPKKVIKANKEDKSLRNFQQFECSNRYGLLEVKENDYEKIFKKENGARNVSNCEKFNDFSFSENDDQIKLFQAKKEVDIETNISRWSVVNTPKRCLKKCRYCNYKKRTCALNSLTCKVFLVANVQN